MILSWAEAIEDVGRKYYGPDWIEYLTQRELWLINNYDLPADLYYPAFDLKPVIPDSMRESLFPHGGESSPKDCQRYWL